MSWVADGPGVTGRDHGTSFPDGTAFRIEIPSLEGPKVLEAVLRPDAGRDQHPARPVHGGPDPLGGVVRGQELGDLIKAGAPLYARFGLRNTQAVYPNGHHLEAVACANAIEKVHRAAVALQWLRLLSRSSAGRKPRLFSMNVALYLIDSLQCRVH
jgi:hypothetical protein